MENKPNREISDFNNGKKNQKMLTEARGYAFVSCPDFSHQNGKFDYKSISNGMPLTLSLAQEHITKLSKDTFVFISDHEAYRDEVCKRVHLEQSEMLEKIHDSLTEIKKFFPNALALSTAYSYQEVSDMKKAVPDDYQMTMALIMWSGDGRTKEVLQELYREKYTQMLAFLSWCKKQDCCAVLLYSKFTLNLVSAIRKQIAVPILFLEMTDPH